MRTELKRETWETFEADARPLLEAHRAEVDPDANSHSPFAINSTLCSALDRVGALVIMTAREDAKLVGYCIWTLGESLDCVATCATQGPWFVLPARRASPLALRLFKESLIELKRIGIARAIPHHWMHGAGPRLGEFFKRLGAEPIETSYSLWLET